MPALASAAVRFPSDGEDFCSVRCPFPAPVPGNSQFFPWAHLRHNANFCLLVPGTEYQVEINYLQFFYMLHTNSKLLCVLSAIAAGVTTPPARTVTD